MKTEDKPRVLVIEDNPDFAQLLSDILVIKGCQTEVAHDAGTALKRVKQITFDLIFSDLNLPGPVNGLRFAELLRADPALANIPLIAISGYASPEDKRRAIAAGFDMAFPKPVKFADLGLALDQFAKGRR